MTDKERARFTEEDAQKLAKLPEKEYYEFNNRLAKITMRKRIVDDQWAKDNDEIEEDLDCLVKEIKDRLMMV